MPTRMRPDDRFRIEHAIAWALMAAAIALIVIGVMFRIESAAAAELSAEQSAVIYAIAYQRSGYPLPDRAPSVHVTSIEKLKELADCGPKCPVKGLTLGSEIYVVDTLDYSNALDASILLHEFVHYFQFVALGEASTCEEWLRREKQAFQIQLAELERAGSDTRPILFAMRNYVC